MDAFGQFALFERLRRAGVAGRILFRFFVLDLEGIRMGAFGFEFPVVVDDVVTANPDDPCHERPRIRPVRIESPINLEEDLLSKILGFIKSSRETVSQVIDPLMVLANDAFPGAMLA